MRTFLLLLLLIPVSALAQGDVGAERASLEGVGSFAADITVEGPRHLVESDVLRSDVILHRIVHRIREFGLEVNRIPPGDPHQPPHLHVHVNMLELDRGLVPFSVSAEFYQDVRLMNGRRDMAAITWQESVLGFVSRDLLATIPESVDGLVDQFVEDYLTANNR